MKHIKKYIFGSLLLSGVLGLGACSSAENPSGINERRPVIQNDLDGDIFKREDTKGVLDTETVTDLISDTGNTDTRFGPVSVDQRNPDFVAANSSVINWVDFGVGPQVNTAIVGSEGVVRSIPLPAFPSASTIDSERYYLTLPQTKQIVQVQNLDKHYSVIQNTGSAPMALAVDGNALFWGEQNGCVFTSTTAGLSTRTIACDAGIPTAMAVANNEIFWATTKGSVFRTNMDGDVKKLANAEHVGSDLLVSGNVLYWSDEFSGDFKALKIGADSVLNLSSKLSSISGLTQDANYIYGTSELNGSVSRYDKNTGAVTPLVTRQSSPASIFGDKGHLYWANKNPGSIIKYSK